MKKIYILFVLFLHVQWGYLQAQNSIDINASSAKNLQAQVSENPDIVKIFTDVDRYRAFEYNTQLITVRETNVGNTLLLNFFDDKQYTSVIQNVSLTSEGRTNILSRIVESEYAYCYITVSESTISISAELPLKDEYFFASVKGGEAYIGQMRLTELKKDELQGSEPLIPVNKPNFEEIILNEGVRGVNDPVTIDLLVVYTQAAETWAANNAGVTDIHDVIEQAIIKANLVMANSNTGITFNVVYKYKTDYVETNSQADLDRITYTNDGYMDEVHDLREAFYADEVLFMPSVNFTGGVAWQLTNQNGFSNGNYAFALSRVEQSSWTYTVVHEIGHNMGAHHHILQNTQPGPGLFSYSSGWRGTNNIGNKVCSVMTYEEGSYFQDGINHTRIPYFSTPSQTCDGVTVVGSSSEDNAQTLKETKTAVAGYRTPPSTPALRVTNNTLSFTNNHSATKMVIVSGSNLGSPISYVKGGANPNAFTVSETSWDPVKGGILSVIFTGLLTQEYNATLTFSADGVSNQIVTLSYSTCLGLTHIQESFDDNNFPPDCWASQSATGTPWQWVATGTNPSCVPHSNSGMLQFVAFGGSTPSTGLLISPEIVANHHNGVLSFWMYRNNTNTASEDRVNIYVSSTPSVSGLTPILTVHRSTTLSPPASNGWNCYTANLPTDTMNTVYVIFEAVKGVTGYGYNIHIDDIMIEIENSPFCGGDGTEQDPYQICNAETLAALATYINTGNGNATANVYYILTDDIDLSNYAGGEGWMPIGKNYEEGSAYCFQGNFDGNNKTIQNLTITRPTENCIGLFGSIIAATVHSLGIEDCNITGDNNVGALTGTSYGHSVIHNCYSTGNIQGGYMRHGGLTGKNSQSEITNCYSACTVNGGWSVGGLTGTNESYSSIENCYATGAVSGCVGIGGLAGSNSINSTVSNSYASGEVTGICGGYGSANSIGGLTGKNEWYSSIENCYATGNVSGTEIIGGLTGMHGGSCIINNCYATGDVVSHAGYAGGLVGKTGADCTITNSYAAGNVTGDNFVGGLFGGYDYSGIAIQNCIAANPSITAISSTGDINRIAGSFPTGNSGNNYALNDMIITMDTETINRPDDANANGTGVNIGTLKSSSFYITINNWYNNIAWNIDNEVNTNVIWRICEGEILPYFQWQDDYVCPDFIPVTNVTLTCDDTMLEYSTLTLTASVAPTNASFQTIVWSIKDDDNTGASIVNGVLTAGSAGTVTITTTIVNGLSIGTDYTKDLEITVIAIVNAQTPTINTQPQNVTITAGAAGATSNVTVSASVTDGGTLTYQWYGNTTATNTGGTLLSGKTASTFAAPIDAVGVFYYYVVVTNTITDNGDGGNKTANVTSNAVTVTVNAKINAQTPTINTQPQNVTTTAGAAGATSNVTVSASVTDGGTLTYQWYGSTTATNTGGTLLSGKTASTFAAPIDAVGVFYYYVVVTNTITDNGDGGNKTANVTSNAVEVRVFELPTVTTIVTGKDTTVCSNTNVDFNLNAMAVTSGDELIFSLRKDFTTTITSLYTVISGNDVTVYIRGYNSVTGYYTAIEAIDSVRLRVFGLPTVTTTVTGKDTIVYSNTNVWFNLATMVTTTAETLQFSLYKDFAIEITSPYPVSPGENIKVYIRAFNTTMGCYTGLSAIDSVTITVIIRNSCASSVWDEEGHEYKVTPLAGFCWTENLRTTLYPGTSDFIPFANPYTSTVSPAQLDTIFGLLYTWYSAVGTPTSTNFVQGICPNGYHIPSKTEWSALERFNTQQLKSTNYWLYPPEAGTDDFGFNAFPAGCYNAATNRYQNLYGFTGWWAADSNPSETTTNYFYLTYYCDIVQENSKIKFDGLSVRCIMDY